MKTLTKIYRNWPVHNVIAHPFSELVYWLVRPFGVDRAKDVSGWVHDVTIPAHQDNEGRG